MAWGSPGARLKLEINKWLHIRSNRLVNKNNHYRCNYCFQPKRCSDKPITDFFFPFFSQPVNKKSKQHNKENPFIGHQNFRNNRNIKIGGNLMYHSTNHPHRFGTKKYACKCDKRKSDGNFPGIYQPV